MVRPSSLKKPCFSATSTNVEFQKPRCATATRNVSALAAHENPTAASPSSNTSVLFMQSSRRFAADLSGRTALLQPERLEAFLRGWAGHEFEERAGRLSRGMLRD